MITYGIRPPWQEPASPDALVTTVMVPVFDEDGDIVKYEEVELVYMERCMALKADEIIITEINGIRKAHPDDVHDAIRDRFNYSDIDYTTEATKKLTL